MKRAPNQPVTTALTIFGGIYAKAYRVPDAGTLLPQHSHVTSHLTALTSGAVRVFVGNDNGTYYEAPALIKIDALTFHSFVTVSDNVGLICIHNADHLDADEPATRAMQELEYED